MSRLTLQSISKSIGERTLFRDINITLEDWDRLSIIGANGCGKSTLLNIISGEDTPDFGQVHVNPSHLGIGYCTQNILAQDLSSALIDWVLQALPSWKGLWDRWQKAQCLGNEKELRRIADEQSKLENSFGYHPETRARSILTGLGFEDSMQAASLHNLSGGWRERAKLAKSLVKGSDILLLDEPTNHLDLESLNWLEQFLKSFKGIVVFVAHERYFLDEISNCVLYLGDGSKPVKHKGNFSSFLNWQAEVQETTRREIDKIDRQIQHKQKFVDRFRYKASKAALAQSRLKQIQDLEEKKQKLHLPEKSKSLGFSWKQPRRSGDIVLNVSELVFNYKGENSLWPELSFSITRGQKIALLGPNGCGKSTLLKLITGAISSSRKLQPGQGNIRLGSKVTTAFFSQHKTDQLEEEGTVLGELRRLRSEITRDEEIYQALGMFLLDESFWEQKIKSLSGGERSRLLLASIFLSGANFLVLDEPTNNLDLESREALIYALKNFGGSLLMVAHDRHLLHEAADELWYLDSNGLVAIEHDYLNNRTLPGKTSNSREEGKDSSKDRENHKKRRKEQKRIQAQRRNYVHQALRPKRERYRELEERLEEVLSKQEEVEAKLADPETYQSEQKAWDTNKSYRELQDQSEKIITEMQKLEEEIQKLQN